MWTVRAAGRECKRAEKKAAPRYSGKPRSTYDYGKAPLAPGELRRSVHSSRRLKRYGPGNYGVTVGPRSARTHLYAAKIDAETGFSAAGLRAARAALPAAADTAWNRVVARANAQGNA